MIRKEIIWIGNAFLIAASLLLAGHGAVVAHGILSEERVIIIRGTWDKDEAKTQVDPNELSVDRGTIVTWINESQTEVKIKFGKGTNCQEVHSKSMGGRLNSNVNPKRCFVTRDSIPSGGTMSVFFTETVQYHYEVEYVGKGRREGGIIKISSGPSGRF